MTGVRLAVIMLAFAGCASWFPFGHPSATLLGRADRRVVEGDYAGALPLYDEVLATYPGHAVAERARASRAVVAALLSAHADLARVERERAAREAELARLRRELAGRDDELSRMKDKLQARQAEVSRLAAEAERLRTDLERLKRIDLAPERRR